ncbi:MAG: peptidoglycan DD-metalloendopeptidase family protein [Turicibacter sp.]|nr:peptidoglycan DD-metalloendopeptidase family protein [Turicibacter sp.]
MKKKIVGVLIATMMLTGNHQKVAEASSLATQNVVYRVYIDDEVVGLITDKEQYEEFVVQQKKELSKQYPEQVVIKSPTNVRLEEEVTLLPLTTIDNQAVLKTVAKKANFQASAYKISIDESTFAVQDANVVSNTLLELMAYYTGEEDIQKIMDIENPIEPLMESGSQYIGAKVVEAVKVDTAYANPDEILTPEETRRMVLYGEAKPKETVIFDEDSSLWYIANDHGMTEEELILLNPQVKGLKWSELLGMELDVTPLNPMITVETEKEKVDISTIAYETEYIDDDTMVKGQTKIQQEGQNGESLKRTKIVYENGSQASLEVVEEKQLSEPVNKVVVRGTKVVSGVGNGSWVWPTTNRSVTCGYLCYSGHYAIDIQAYIGQPVYAADNGVVVSAGYSGAYGYNILINHKNGYYTRYAHLNSLSVSAGDTVQGGQTIGEAGNTGNSTGPHLHFEIRTNTGSQPSYAPNPLDFY